MKRFHVDRADKRKGDMKTKMKLLCMSINKRLEWALNNMLINSSQRLKDLVRYLLLAFSVDGDQQAKFDRLMAESMYILKCQGMDKFNKVPVDMTWGHHPRALFSRQLAPFTRRIHLIRYYGRYYMNKIKHGRLMSSSRKHGY
jgi:hypothetical protein